MSVDAIIKHKGHKASALSLTSQKRLLYPTAQNLQALLLQPCTQYQRFTILTWFVYRIQQDYIHNKTLPFSEDFLQIHTTMTMIIIMSKAPPTAIPIIAPSGRISSSSSSSSEK
jgi:hypothetical protein